VEPTFHIRRRVVFAFFNGPFSHFEVFGASPAMNWSFLLLPRLPQQLRLMLFLRVLDCAASQVFLPPYQVGGKEIFFHLYDFSPSSPVGTAKNPSLFLLRAWVLSRSSREVFFFTPPPYHLLLWLGERQLVFPPEIVGGVPFTPVLDGAFFP